MKAEYVDHMGDDLSVVNAARVSFDKVSDWEWVDDGAVEFREESIGGLEVTKWPEHKTGEVRDGLGQLRRLSEPDTRLINYLARGCSEAEWHDHLSEITTYGTCAANYRKAPTGECYKDILEDTVKILTNMATHWTPFTHTAITLRMQAPVPIRTQCFKHKQGFTENEESRRYISGTPEFFVPDHFRLAAKNVKQGSGPKHLFSDYWRDEYKEICAAAIKTYEEMISDNVCPEQARFVLPQGVEVSWIWTGNLASYARFYNQRIDPHAQAEIQQLAKKVGEIIEPLFPVSWAALTS